MRTVFEVVIEYLDNDNNTEDFTVVGGGDTYSEALKFANGYELTKEHGRCCLSIWESDDKGNLEHSHLIKTNY